MPAYCLFDNIEITDEAKMEEYRRHTPEIVEKFGGRYVVAGGRTETVEGDPKLNDPVMIEFPSLEHALKWYNSPDYEDLKALRLSAAKSNAIFMEEIQTAEEINPEVGG